MDERIIHSDDCVVEGVEFLVRSHPQFSRAFTVTGKLPLRLRADGFSQLLSAIVSQQVSVASANAIWERLKQAKLTTEHMVAVSTDEELRALGLSRQKARYAKALADAQINYDDLRVMEQSEVIKTLTAVSGIGAWTAEVYTMFSLGRADVFAPGDLALQEGAKMVFDLPERPNEKELRKMSEDWVPWRSVAARLLWAYYAVQKSREGIQ